MRTLRIIALTANFSGESTLYKPLEVEHIRATVIEGPKTFRIQTIDEGSRFAIGRASLPKDVAKREGVYLFERKNRISPIDILAYTLEDPRAVTDDEMVDRVLTVAMARARFHKGLYTEKLTNANDVLRRMGAMRNAKD